MGAWGNYDDECDIVQDVWISIIKTLLPKTFEKLYESVTDVEALNRVRDSYVKNDIELLNTKVTKWIVRYKKTIKSMKDEIEQEIAHGVIVGICLKLIRFTNNLPMSDPLGAGIFNNLIPSGLSKGYPEELRKLAIESIQELIKIIDKNNMNWRDLKKRKSSLHHELFLFTKGKNGIQGKVAKPLAKK
jgi:hypothetical protein